MLDAMAARGIDVSACTVDPDRPTGATVILTSGRDRAMLTAMGTIGALDVDAVPGVAPRPGAAPPLGRFYLQETSRDRLPAFFAAARARGLTTSFDTNWDPTERWDGGVIEMLRAADVFFPNAAEARRIARIADVGGGGAGARVDGRRRADRRRPDRGVKLRRRRRPRRAGRAVRSSASRRMPVDPIDTTGAGDSFDAGFLRAWLDGGDLAREPRVRRRPAGRSRRGGSAASTASRRSPRRGGASRPGERMTRVASDARPAAAVRRGEPVDRPALRGRAADGGRDPPAEPVVAVPGGKGLNAARAAATLGGRSPPSGSSPAGRRLDRRSGSPSSGSTPGWCARAARRGRASRSSIVRRARSPRSTSAVTPLDPRRLGGARGDRRRRARAGRRRGRRAVRQPAAGRAGRRLRPARRASPATVPGRSRSSPTRTDRRSPPSSPSDRRSSRSTPPRPATRPASPSPTPRPARRRLPSCGTRRRLRRRHPRCAGRHRGIGSGLEPAPAAATRGAYPVGSGDAFLGGLAVGMSRGA